jgi:hypothetical protein
LAGTATTRCPSRPRRPKASALEPFDGRSEYANHGQRVVEGQRLMQAATDILVGWLRVEAPDGATRDFYVRQLWDAKRSAPVQTMDVGTLAKYAELCAVTLARAHARSGDAVAIASYLGAGDVFDRALASLEAPTPIRTSATATRFAKRCAPRR